MGQSIPQIGRAFAGSLLQTPVESRAKAQFELSGGLVGKRYRNNPVHLRQAGFQHVDDAPHQLRCLAGSRRGFDDQALVQ